MVKLETIDKPEPKPEEGNQGNGILLENLGGTVPISAELGEVAQIAINVDSSSALEIRDV